MSDTPPEDLLDAYLFGELPDEDVARVDAYLASNSGARGYVTGIRDALAKVVPPIPSEVEAADRLLVRIDREIGSGRGPTSSDLRNDRRQRKISSWRPSTLAVGVAVVAVMVIAAVGRMVVRHGHVVDTAQTYATTTGQRASLSLSDGTRVTLAPESKLVVSNGFGASTRTVTLTGEGYFDVSTATGAPFTVTTGSITTRVLGTAFTVRSYEHTSPVEIAVKSGKVMAHGRTAPIVISAGRVAYVTDSTATIDDLDHVRQHTDWEHGFLVFNDAPVSAILASLSRWYGYEFRLLDSTMAGRQVSATFKVADAQEMLAMLRIGLDAAVTVQGNVITVRPRSPADGGTRLRVRDEWVKPSMEMGK